MIHSYHILFFLYKSKANDKGCSPIFCRITFNNTRKQFSTGHFVSEKNWSSQAQHIKGNSKETKRVNSNLDLIKQKLNKAYDELIREKEFFYIDDIYNRFSGNDKEYKTLLQAFDYHNKKMKTLIGKDYVQATYDKFVVIQTHVTDFIRHQYNKPDYPLFELRLNFLADLDYYLKVVKNQNQNTINKVIERVKKVIKIAVGNGWLTADPFILYQKKKYSKEVVFLTVQELKKLENHKFVQERLDAVRDCFIFSCYTGLAYNEAALLSDEHLQPAEDGFTWIEMVRQKTQRPIVVPILPRAIRILKKYGYPRAGLLLPAISNQKMNSYLKEIGSIVGINKVLTHHIARKTYASTVLMNNDIPVEIVSFLLGHSKTSTTEMHYAKVVKDSVTRHIKELAKKL
ncbi:phage integrase SAM-like domain-containing protein [Mucilaginibacter sp. HD30]